MAVAPDGTVLVADSGTGRIFALQGRSMTVWSDAPELKSVNGLLAEPGRLVATTMEGKLLAIDYPARGVKVLATGLGQADGVSAGDGDNYFVSEWPGRLFRVTPDGHAQVLMDTRKKGAYINDFIRVGDLLIVPSWEPGKVTAYRVLTWMLTEADPRGASAAAAEGGSLGDQPLTGASSHRYYRASCWTGCVFLSNQGHRRGPRNGSRQCF